MIDFSIFDTKIIICASSNFVLIIDDPFYKNFLNLFNQNWLTGDIFKLSSSIISSSSVNTWSSNQDEHVLEFSLFIKIFDDEFDAGIVSVIGVNGFVLLLLLLFVYDNPLFKWPVSFFKRFSFALLF